MDEYHAVLKKQEEKNAPELLSKHKLVCKQLQYGNCAPLYVAKPHWTNRFDSNRESTVGIFYAIWVSEKPADQGKYFYNIHSKKLKDLPNYKLRPRKFADEFRSAIEARVSNWPGIRMDYGPSTLLQGHDVCDVGNFARKIDQRLKDLVSIYTEIDGLLDASAIT